MAVGCSEYFGLLFLLVESMSNPPKLHLQLFLLQLLGWSLITRSCSKCCFAYKSASEGEQGEEMAKQKEKGVWFGLLFLAFPSQM